jgi:hypothetical protein
MKPDSAYGPFKVVALVVLSLMALTGLYAGYMAVALWSGIGV